MSHYIHFILVKGRQEKKEGKGGKEWENEKQSEEIEGEEEKRKKRKMGKKGRERERERKEGRWKRKEASFGLVKLLEFKRLGIIGFDENDFQVEYYEYEPVI